MTEQMVHCTINGVAVEVPKGTSVREAALKLGFRLPALCNVWNNPTKPGQCGLCVAEVRVRGRKKNVPSCKTAVTEGMEVKTFTPEVLEARETAWSMRRKEHFAESDCSTCPDLGGCKFLRLGAACSTGRDQEEEDNNPWIIVDPKRCTSCGQCAEACEAQDVRALLLQYHGGKPVPVIDHDACSRCGQCIKACPTGTLRERSYVQRVLGWLNDPSVTVVIQYAPSIAPTLAVTHGQFRKACELMGFVEVFPTGVGADIITMEETHEALQRSEHNGPLPIVTSCCPGQILDARHYLRATGREHLLRHVSSCLSPQEALSRLIRSVWAPKHGHDGAKLKIVSVMPCTAKAGEAEEHGGVTDVVLTTRQFIELLNIVNVRPALLPDAPLCNPFSDHSGGAEIFARSGGVTEAVLRHVCKARTGRELVASDVKRTPFRPGMIELSVTIDGLTIKALVVRGLQAAHEVWELIDSGEALVWLMIEFMACSQGCINGGGQPKVPLAQVAERIKRLTTRDTSASEHTALDVDWLQVLYEELGGVGGHMAHELFHEHEH